jgi:hypothetical protein
MRAWKELIGPIKYRVHVRFRVPIRRWISAHTKVIGGGRPHEAYEKCSNDNTKGIYVFLGPLTIYKGFSGFYFTWDKNRYYQAKVKRRGNLGKNGPPEFPTGTFRVRDNLEEE